MASITCQIGIPMGIRHTFSQTRLQPLLIPSSSIRRTLPLPWRLEFRLALSNGEGVYPCSTWVEMLTVYV